MFRKKKRKDKLVKQTTKKRQGKDSKPREINLDALPYYPLPPAPSQWDPSTFVHSPYSPPEDFFEASEGAEFTIESISKIEMEYRPDPAYKTSKLQTSGVLFIDKTGRSKAFAADSMASLLRRDFQGNITAAAGLDHDIYRIGTNAFGDHSVFLSGEAYLHAYNENLEPILVYNLAEDKRITMIRDSEISMDGPPRRQIRRVSINPDGDRILFTIADTAWCMSPSMSSIWAVCMPLKDGWKRTYTRSSQVGTRGDVEEALRLMQLRLPVTQEQIKSQYRALAFQWHPDYAGNTPENNKKMQELNRTFSILTGIDPKHLDIKNKDQEVVSFKRTKAAPGIKVDVGNGVTLEISFGADRPALDWIYAANFCSSSNSVFLGSYDGKIININENGEAHYVIDVGNIPRKIMEIDKYLYIATDTRLYVLGPDLELIELIDLTLEGELIAARNGFNLVAEKKVSFHTRDGKEIGEIKTKHPIRAVYESGDKVIVESRQHRAVVCLK
ncbi:MAG: DnaJ domain-containing protein [Chloroflexi bacterium]|nr:DnaJ domain-containing protein [Chloroflexota bacterium]